MRRQSCVSLLVAAVAMLGWSGPTWARQTAKGRNARVGGPAKAAGRFTSPVPAGLWLGQDGHDVVGPSSAAGPSDVQDIHIALAGLPRDRAIRFAKISPLGGGEWIYNGPYGPWRAEVERAAGSPTADLYLEPTQDETGRPFHVLLKLDDGRDLEFDVGGGRADANLRMPGTAMAVRWVGQDGQDRVGLGPAVGPDGAIDAHLALTNLSRTIPIEGLEVRGPGGGEWHSGANPKGASTAELLRHGDDPTKADLFLGFDRDPAGQKLQVLVRYSNNKTDSARCVAGRVDPKKKVARPKPPAAPVAKLASRWHGQDGTDPVGPGDIHVTLGGLPEGPIVAAVLSDSSRGSWVFKAAGAPPLEGFAYALPMALRQDADGSTGLFFPPFRDETGGKLLLRVFLGDGRALLGEFPGGPADPGLRAGPGPAASQASARPGEDLQAMVGRAGTVRLAAGRHVLKRPLILEKPVRIVGETGASLVFSQAAGDPEWPAAIQIYAGHTTLEGFAVRFASPIRWAGGQDFGPAVIGATENPAPGPHDLKADLTFRKLDLEAPPAAGALEEAPRSIRLRRCVNGLIEGCVLKGGMIEMEGGPWRVVGNRFAGPMPGTYSYAAISAHSPHDMVVKDNVAKPAEGSGKLWRFLVMTGSGHDDLVEGNTIEGVGPRVDDTIPNMNAPEIILTESYSLHFEGRPLAVGPDGRVLVIPALQGEPAGTGDVVAILTGPQAGQWRRIAQAMGPTAYLLDGPLPAGEPIVSIATGFVGETIRKNRIDSRGGAGAANLVLVGNLFGLTVAENHLLGEGAFKISAAPTENPVHWGWSHAPLLGLTFEGNLVEDSARAGIGVEHSAAIKTTKGRVYASAVVRGNTFRWSKAFAARPGAARVVAMTLGDPGSLDPSELVVTEEDNHAQAGTIRAVAAKVNGKVARDEDLPLARPPAGAAPTPPGGKKR